jgi:hypothetical protein
MRQLSIPHEDMERLCHTVNIQTENPEVDENQAPATELTPYLILARPLSGSRTRPDLRRQSRHQVLVISALSRPSPPSDPLDEWCKIHASRIRWARTWL